MINVIINYTLLKTPLLKGKNYAMCSKKICRKQKQWPMFN
jgi:hypothetical protein